MSSGYPPTGPKPRWKVAKRSPRTRLNIGNVAGNENGIELLRSHAGDRGASIIAVEEFEMKIAEPDEFHVLGLIECG